MFIIYVGIASLRMKHVQEFESKSYALCREFKTSNTFVYQPVILTEKTKLLLLNIYVAKLRKLVQPRNLAPGREDPLFIAYNGASELLPGRLVQAYFRRKLNISVTITTIRGIIETEAAERLATGAITEQQRSAINSINGHSSIIANEYYVRTDMDAIVARGRAAMGEPSSGAAPLLHCDARSPPSTPAYPVDEWGLDHPDRYKTEGKARWTAEETDYLLAVADHLQSERGGHSYSRIMSDCLKRIKEDPSTRRIFHQRHIMSTDRLRAGYREPAAARASSVVAATALMPYADI